MNKPNVAKVFKTVQAGLSKHSPAILTGLGITGFATTAVLAVRATPKALKLIEAKKQEENLEKLPPIEVVKATWKCYIPAVVSGATSAACLIGAHSVHAKRNAVIATAYKLSETALAEYKEQVIDTIGEKKEKTVREKVAKKQLEENPVTKSEVVVTKKGDVLFLEPTSTRYFTSDIETIRSAVNNLNDQLLRDMFGYISLNDLYDEIDLGHTSIGDDLGWNVEGGQIKLDFSYAPASDGTPCAVLNYDPPPKYGFNKFS